MWRYLVSTFVWLLYNGFVAWSLTLLELCYFTEKLLKCDNNYYMRFFEEYIILIYRKKFIINLVSESRNR